MPPRKTRAAQKSQVETPPLTVEDPASVDTPIPDAKPKAKSRAARHQPLLVSQNESTPHDTTEPDTNVEVQETAQSENTPASSSTSKPSLHERQAKLADLRAKMAATTKANRKDILNEQSRSRAIASDANKPASSRKLQKAEKLLEERDLKQSGEDVERYRNMLYSVEDSERWDAKLETKEQRKDQGQMDFQDAAERSYQRQVKQLKPDLAAYRQQRDQFSSQHSSSPATSALVHKGKGKSGEMVRHLDSFGESDTIHYGSHKPSDDAIDRVVSHLNHEQQIIKNRSRKRQEDPDADVTYINDRNKHFNKKLKRFFDNKTKEIRDNLERGTAL